MEIKNKDKHSTNRGNHEIVSVSVESNLNPLAQIRSGNMCGAPDNDVFKLSSKTDPQTPAHANPFFSGSLTSAYAVPQRWADDIPLEPHARDQIGILP